MYVCVYKALPICIYTSLLVSFFLYHVMHGNEKYNHYKFYQTCYFHEPMI